MKAASTAGSFGARLGGASLAAARLGTSSLGAAWLGATSGRTGNRALLVAAFFASWLASAQAHAEPNPFARDSDSQLVLTVDTPTYGAVIGDTGGMGFVAGKALAHSGEFRPFDIVFVIDQSNSTSEPSGGDIDRDGVIGRRRGDGIVFLSWFGTFVPITDPDDTILSAEITAVDELLSQLDPRSTRVGVIGFAGDLDPTTPDAEVYSPLTSEYERVRAALQDIRDAGPGGNTNMTEALQLATVELLGSGSAYSEPRPEAQKVILFLSDGRPTLPDTTSVHQNQRLTIEAAQKAARLGIRIDSFAIGELALAEPSVTIEMANVSQGVFTPVYSPHELEAAFGEVRFSRVEALEIVNRANGRSANLLQRGLDGSFAALVPLELGENDIEVYARSTDGEQRRKRIAVRLIEDAPVQALNPRLRRARNHLLELRVAELQRRQVEMQLAKEEEVRESLAAEMREKQRKAENEAQRRVRIETQDEPTDPERTPERMPEDEPSVDAR